MTHLFSVVAFISVLGGTADNARQTAAATMVFTGSSDASAAVALDDQHFIVADDENNALRIYRLGHAAPVLQHDITPMLGLESEHPEADIEACTRVGDRIYWITSHGRNKSGKRRPNRYRFFATTVPRPDDTASLERVGKPCLTLARALADSAVLAPLNLRMAMHLDGPEPPKKLRKLLAPKEQGLNIEALAASADGRTIYIGLRNPRPLAPDAGGPMACVIPLLNAPAVIDHGATPQLGEALLWDLQGYGLRAMEYAAQHEAFFIVAGPHQGHRGCVIMRWSGDPTVQPSVVRTIPRAPEAVALETVIIPPGTPRILLLSDDGSLPIAVDTAAECIDKLSARGTCANKHLADLERRSFRGVWLDPT